LRISAGRKVSSRFFSQSCCITACSRSVPNGRSAEDVAPGATCADARVAKARTTKAHVAARRNPVSMTEDDTKKRGAYNLLMKQAASRRRFLTGLSAAGLTSVAFGRALWAQLQQAQSSRVTPAMVAEASRLAGLTFSETEQQGMLPSLNRILARAEDLHRTPPGNDAPSPIVFTPRVPGVPVELPVRVHRPSTPPPQSRPATLEDLAFWPVMHLADLIRRRLVSAEELTDLYLRRLERHNPTLNCVVTLTAERARAQARDLDRELAAGTYRGLLHGIPCGVKDIIAAKGYPTSWGAAPFKARVIDEDATVVQRLTAAGAVLVAKLTTGEFAFGDEWFGGRTNNPWNPAEGSSGSSAGSGAAVAAGLVGFAIGTDTGGSILSPAVRCGAVGLRPTFGRVSRRGVMAAGWTLDKVGALCRSVEDCAIVLHAIAGPDGYDLAVPTDMPYAWDARESAKGRRVGVVAGMLEREPDAAVRANNARALDALRAAGLELRTVDVPTSDLSYFIEYTERAAGFETVVQSGQDAGLRSQRVRNDLRAYHLVTAVDYLQANRERLRLMELYARATRDVDVVIGGSVTLDNTSLNPITSLTGHPAVAVPTGFRPNGTPTGFTLAGRLYDEAGLLVVARVIEAATGLGGRRPSLA
jgi:Asp-tRNA(Asn)/Glu-tRNA(Gln) amidotransferase A subunit family amidase